MTKKKDEWVEGYLKWKETMSNEDYEIYCKDKIYEAEQSVKGSLPPCACDEELIRPLTQPEDNAVSWLVDLLRSYEDR